MEVLVVLTLITLVLAVSVPFVLNIRESARKVDCQSRLKFLGMACHEYQVLNGVYPPGCMFGRHGWGPDSTAWSWMARILPFISRSELQDRGGIPRQTLRASGVAQEQVSEFLCPSDQRSARGPREDAGNMIEHGFAVGQTNYKGVSGSNWGADRSQGIRAEDVLSPWRHRGTNGSFDGLSNGDGMFFRDDYRLRRSPVHVRDGFSQTLMLGEDLPSHDAYCSWPYSNNAYSTCAIPVNTDGCGHPFDWLAVQSFRSNHAGGANFVFVDGRVEFIQDKVDLSLYRSLATVDGGAKELSSLQNKGRHSTSR